MNTLEMLKIETDKKIEKLSRLEEWVYETIDQGGHYTYAYSEEDRKQGQKDIKRLEQEIDILEDTITKLERL